MAEHADLNDALFMLAQSLSDIVFVVNVLRELRRNSDRLLEPLREELRGLQDLITHVVTLL